jgi:hypothetical protein
MPAVAKPRFMQVTEQLVSASSRPINFVVVMKDQVAGTDYSLCIAEEIQHPRVGREVAPFH